ncbi:saccharopine dehydrogenase family protein [Oceanitalea stevensii]|uniref:Saccharopine dehydrogenase NADP-binding domain-containing protein n=1 Tax=Oceanitalea stevensii TaxID=2763072 RepID=A0ABR8Z0R1_9MICO|nr:saccharopine dehydrogenase NADP-binding domain-containing protein [Oceanitalea stevensii]MBD8061916.1 saccharopine dehydrogenase NADP-binding domain-containing protein [Oceanitalea stevensii]
MTAPSVDRALDVVVYGASGFVGRLVAEYLAEHAPGTRVGLAGRSRERLEQVRDGLGPAAAAWPVVVAGAEDDAALAELAASTRVVVTTVGPYSRHGMPLARACAEAGTHYADLAGEVLFIHETSQWLHDTARRTGSRIVHSCGFDSVPSDLGAFLTAERARADGAGELLATTLAVRSASGGVSGGTIDSMRIQVDAGRDPDNRRILTDPYALVPDRADAPDVDQHTPSQPFRDAQTGTWVTTFPMAAFNSRIVHRSNALSGWSYGRDFRYREVVDLGPGPRGRRRAQALSLATGAAAGVMAFPPTRWVADRVLPSPGDGPDEETRRNGYFRMEVVARTTTGARYRTVVAAQGDPGYAATSVMIGESALALAYDESHLPGGGGVLTPATALGTVLADRLVAAGFEITTERLG